MWHFLNEEYQAILVINSHSENVYKRETETEYKKFQRRNLYSGF